MHACVAHRFCCELDLEPVAQALHPCTALCFNANRLCRLGRVQAAGVLLPPLKHTLLDLAPQLEPHFCLIRLVPCLQRKLVKPKLL